MKKTALGNALLLTVIWITASECMTRAATHYADLNSASPTPPYTNWTTAATSIQAAVDSAQAGDTVLVTNGLYATGGRALYPGMLNRVAVTKAILLQSVNGPAVTSIVGKQVTGITNGNGAVRCVCLTNGAVLSGFTLTNGATGTNGDQTFGQSGGGVWCASTAELVTNCVIVGNSAAVYGGGAFEGTLLNCVITKNYSAGLGGGANGNFLANCALTVNSASAGGGAYSCTLTNCTLTGNFAFGLSDDVSKFNGGGGAAYCSLYNSIVQFNNAVAPGDNCSYSTLTFCCTTPLPETGVGNSATDPQLASNYRLSSDSPCRGAGSATYASGVDIDGEAWAAPPSMGCDEYVAAGQTGPLSVALSADYTNLAVGYELQFRAQIDGRAAASRWEFGDGSVLSNRLYATHAWTAAGNYAVVLRVYNQDYPGGIAATSIVQVVGLLTNYVSADSLSPVPPYDSWDTAAAAIQDAVDTAVPGAVVLVNDGTYATGGRVVYGRMTNRVALIKPIRLQSVNGPAATTIQGYQVPGTITGDAAVRCVYLGEGTVVSGFTLTGGATRLAGNLYREQSGGGAWCVSTRAILTNCTVSGNAAAVPPDGGSGRGGGVYQGTLSACVLDGNSADAGGAVYLATLLDCELSNNSARFGGGANTCTLNNCSLANNQATVAGAGASGGFLTNCILTGNSVNNMYPSDHTGGGARDSFLYNCLLTGNSVNGGTQFTFGGGAYGGTLVNCVLSGNSVAGPYGSGGGARHSYLLNCTVVGNSADYQAGGVGPFSQMVNCIAYNNTAGVAGDNYYTDNNLAWIDIFYTCTTPLPSLGIGNITNEPVFVDFGGGDLHLQTNSPCINSGNNSRLTAYDYFNSVWITNLFDLDGNSRLVGGTVDMGAYEFQSPTSLISYAWLQQYGLPIDGSADHSDPDGDGMNNWQEWRCDTDPTNVASVLTMLAPANTNNLAGVTLSWLGVGTRSYFIERSTNLAGLPAFSVVATNLPGQVGTNTYTDTTASGLGPFLYRVGVGN